MKKTALALLLMIFCFTAIIGIGPVLSVADVADDTWVSKTSMQQARLRHGTAAVNGKIYAIGGDDLRLSGNVISADWYYGTILGTNEEYDPVRGAWTLKEPLPTPRTHFGIAVYKDRIYCIGGQSSEGDSAVNEVYNPKTNSWETKAIMPTNRTRVSANVVNGKIYVVSQGVNEVYDPLKNSWATRTPPPFRFYSTASAVIGNKIYFIGGVDSTPVTNFRIRIYDTSNDSWSYGALSPIYGATACAGVLTSINATTKVYFFDESSTHIYDPATDSWTNSTRMQRSRGFADAVVLDDTFYVVGGIFAPFEGYIVITSSAATNEQYIPSGYSGSVDIVKPNIFIMSPQNKTHFAADIDLRFFADEPLSWMRYSLNAQKPVEIVGNVTLTGLAYGYHNLTVIGTDTSGNTGYSETVFFAIAEEQELFSVVLVAAVIVVAVAGVGLLFFLKRRKRQVGMVET